MASSSRHGAGAGIGASDREYELAGGSVVATADDVYAGAEMIVKVKEPQVVERARLRAGPGAVHLPASCARPAAMCRPRCRRRDVHRLRNGHAKPAAACRCSRRCLEVAGRMSVQAAAHSLERAHGGCGMLLGGVPGVPPAKIVILGAGVVGSNAAQMAVGTGALVVVIDRQRRCAAPHRPSARCASDDGLLDRDNVERAGAARRSS